MLLRDWQVRLEDMVDALVRIQQYTHGMSFEEFIANQMAVDAVLHNLTVLGEAARNVPPEVQARDPGIPWAEIRGMRNVLAHEYSGVNLPIIWQTIVHDLPPLLPKLRQILAEEGGQGAG